MMIYYATYKAHGTRYTSKQHDTLEAVEREVFGQAYAPSKDSVTFWQQQTNSTD
jgi:hypothetical protein